MRNTFLMRDPRSVARDIPGIFQTLFPQLVPGIVAHFNQRCTRVSGCKPLSDSLIKESKLSRAMLFEIAFARGEQLINGKQNADWNLCLDVAADRQRRYFDASIPKSLTNIDKTIAELVAKNMIIILSNVKANSINNSLVISPKIPGFHWISSGFGDFSVDTKIIEVKCSSGYFSARDFRQILIYWLLSYAASVEGGTLEWQRGYLINPRLNRIFDFDFNEIITLIGAGRSKVEILQLFTTMVGEHTIRMLSSNEE